MLKKLLCLFLCSALFFITVPCISCFAKDQPQKQLQTKIVETKAYSVGNTKDMMKTIINILQDDGFSLKTANLDLGIMTANKDFSKKGFPTISSIIGNSIGLLFGIPLAICSFGILSPIPLYFMFNLAKGSSKAYTIEACINVIDENNGIKVKVNFQEKLIVNNQEIKIKKIINPVFYLNFFNNLDKSLATKTQQQL